MSMEDYSLGSWNQYPIVSMMHEKNKPCLIIVTETVAQSSINLLF